MSEFALCVTLGYNFNSFVIIEKIPEICFTNCWHCVAAVCFVKILKACNMVHKIDRYIRKEFTFFLCHNRLNMFFVVLLCIFKNTKKSTCYYKKCSFVKSESQIWTFHTKGDYLKMTSKKSSFFIESEIKLHQLKRLIEILLFYWSKKKTISETFI